MHPDMDVRTCLFLASALFARVAEGIFYQQLPDCAKNGVHVGAKLGKLGHSQITFIRIIANWYYPHWGCRVDFFHNLGLKNGWDSTRLTCIS